jgi:hypothetical protein
MATTLPNLAPDDRSQYLQPLPMRTLGNLPQMSMGGQPASPTAAMAAMQPMAATPPMSQAQIGGVAPAAAVPSTLPTLKPMVSNPLNDLAQKPAISPLSGNFWHKLGQVASRIGQAGAAAFIPGAAMAEEMIPGSMLYNMNQHQQAQQEMERSKQDTIAQQNANSEMALRQAQTENIPQERELKQQEFNEQLSTHGLKVDPTTGKVVAQDPEEYSPEFKADKELKEAQLYGLKNPWSKLPDKEPLENVDNLNSAFQQRYDVYHPGAPLPKEFQLGAGATKGDYDRMDKMLNAIETAEGAKENNAAKREDAQAARAQAHAIAMMGLSMRENKQDASQKSQVYKTYQPVMDSAERMNVMTQNYEDAVGKHDQQAMLSLLYNHMGMTMGLQKGARMTRDSIHEAQQSQPFLQGMGAKFDSRGYLTGITLSTGQMREMINNAQGRYQEDVRKARGEAAYLGARDDGPERTPNNATIHYYLGLAGGNAQRAKQLAGNDGWAVK